MDHATQGQCTTCYGSGEMVTERGPEACPDCFGDGKSLASGNKLEWRLHEIARAHRGTLNEKDILWLVHELRRSRIALVGILTRCQDEEDRNGFAEEIRFRANEALGIYEPS